MNDDQPIPDGDAFLSPRRKACLSILADSREALTLCRQALWQMRENWVHEAESEGMADDLCTIFVSRALAMATEHVSLIGRFLLTVGDAVEKTSPGAKVNDRLDDKLELIIRTGVPHWGDQVETIRRADEAWARGNHIRLGRKRG
jgi:hypothetical protein